MGNLFAFISSVFFHYIALGSGGVGFLVYLILEYRQVKLSWRRTCAIFIWGCLFGAVFLAWQEEHTKVTQRDHELGQEQQKKLTLERELRQEQQKKLTLEREFDNTSTQVTQLQRELTQFHHKQSVMFVLNTDVQPPQLDGSTVMMNLDVVALNLGTSNITFISVRAYGWVNIRAPDASGKIIHGFETVSNQLSTQILKPKDSQVLGTLNLKLDLKKYVDKSGATMRVIESPQERCIVISLFVEATSLLLVYPFKIIRLNPDGTHGGGFGRRVSPDMYDAPPDQYAHTSWVLHKCEVDQPYSTEP